MIVGVDVGTQSLKAVVCTGDLRVVGSASRSYDYEVPKPGWAEQDPELWLAALGPAVAEALEAADVSAAYVKAVGIAGQLDGCVAVDGSANAIGKALIWMDRRAAAALPVIDADLFLERTGQVIDASHMAAKIAWMKSRGVGAARFHQPVSFVLEALTGASVIDPANASTTMLFDQAAGDWAESYLEAFGVAREELPLIMPAHALAGALTEVGARLTSLLPDTPVAVGTGDDFATPLGAGIAMPGVVACVLGTAEVVGAVSSTRVLDRERLLETHNYFADRYFVENPGWLSGGALRWLCDLLGVADAAALDALAAQSIPGAGGVTFVPALTGAMAPRWVASARGSFTGLSAATQRGDLSRAVLEGCAFAMRDVVARLAELDLEPAEIRLLGGGSRSQLWAQIRADVSGLPVRLGDESETCAIGAALLAAVAIGVHPSIEVAAELIAPPTREVSPERDLSEPYARYREVFDRLNVCG